MQEDLMAGPLPGFLERLRNAGIDPQDSDELRLNKSLLMFATGLVSLASMLWLAIYWSLGPKLSATLPFAFQILLAANLAIYLKTGNFAFFRVSQLGLFLFFPFVVQWSIGNVITASGIVLWGLLAPIGSILFFGVRESIAWFFAYVFLVVLSGFFDYYLADVGVNLDKQIPVRTSIVFFALNFIAVSTIVYLLLRFSAQEKDKTQSRLREAHQLLQEEQERSERLLLNVLPAPVAERLKHSNQPIADGFADATVMFADIVNFTQVASGMTPTQVFAMLNRIFSSFDELAEKFGLEKIKTIGDAYMVAGGLNDGRPDYCDAVAEMAIAMRELLRNDMSVNAARLEIRIGISTGPVVAGVVGRNKFIYDLWGDTVNIASRITADGAPGMIQVDAITYRRLRDRFDFYDPQALIFKGKGTMTVYRLSGKKVPIRFNGGSMPIAAAC
jgi:class 3 adenylate cyclase